MQSRMKDVRGLFLPATEDHLTAFLMSGPEFAGGPTYQLHKFLPAVPSIKNFRHAIDIGAHCGLWTRVLARMFSHVTAFEPIGLHADCLVRNVPLTTNGNSVDLRRYALGAEEGQVHLHTGKGSSGDTFVKEAGEHLAELHILDEETFVDQRGDSLTEVNFIKIDCEGYEYYILRGAEKLIKRTKPVIIVEQKPGKGKQFGLDDTAACKLLQSWGAQKLYDYSGDYCYAWK